MQAPSPSYHELQARLAHCMLADVAALRARLNKLAADRRANDRGPADPHTPPSRRWLEAVDHLAADIEASAARRARRLENLPRPTFPAELPVVEVKSRIAEAVAANQVVVICGQTGSGKTTQLPKICLELGRGVAGLIGHTQPRRVAARSVAARISHELNQPLGRAVGYKVRFGDHTSPDTYIKLMTDGILLAETQGDPRLTQYDTIIIDEAHERSLNIDFLLGYLRQLLPRRPDLKVIVTSATIDPERFSRHFGGAPIIEAPGRMYPVDVVYRSPLADLANGEAADPVELERLELDELVLHAVDEAAAMGPGDILVFLPGEREIRDAAEALRKHHPPQAEILPLYARLSPDEQMRVFDTHRSRRIVLATNVAETSLTVPGIRYVVDTGLARIKRYNPRTKVHRLPIEPISRASADQRKGRCGRVGPGVCIRLYAEEDFNARPEFTDPEIVRTNLASVILQMKALRLGRIEDFPFVEPPDGRAIRDGYDTLRELGAIDDEDELTALGGKMAALPIDPRLARILLAAEREACLAEALVIAAVLSVQDPRERPMDAADMADEAHAQWADPDSDFAALLKLWSFYHEQKQHLSHSKLRKLCRTNFISYLRMREWEEIHQQLKALLTEMGHKPSTTPAQPEAIHRALLTGLLSGIGKKGEQHEYAGARGLVFNLWPGSGLFRKGPRWVMAAEVVQTTRTYARTVAKIQPEWVERVAAHLVKRTYTEPHWDPDTGCVHAYERVTLYGLELVSKRRVNYGPIDPRASREIFIHRALVEGEMEPKPPFLAANMKLQRQVAEMEDKARRRGLLADAGARFFFFDTRLGRDVYSIATLERWRRDAEQKNPRLLFMRLEDLLAAEQPPALDQAYPETLVPGDRELAVKYRYDPGAPDDGVTLAVPLHAVERVDPRRCEWLVPGMLEEKITELVRLLPRDLRHYVTSAPDFAKAAVNDFKFGQGDLAALLSERLGKLIGVDVPLDAWRFGALPLHLQMNVRVHDDDGRHLAEGREPGELRRQLAPLAIERFHEFARGSFDRSGLTDWTFGELPESVELERYGIRITGYPGLVDEGKSVALRLFRGKPHAELVTRAGLRRLFALQAADDLRHAVRALPDLDRLAMKYAAVGAPMRLKSDLADLIAERACMTRGSAVGGAEIVIVRSRADFDARLLAGTRDMHKIAMSVRAEVSEILGLVHDLSVWLTAAHAAALRDSVADMQRHLTILVPDGFLTQTSPAWFRHLPRFLKGIQVRLNRLGNAGVARDQRAMSEFAPFWARFIERARQHHARNYVDPGLERHRWLLEEFRISLFAQELRTSVPVSPKRLEEHWRTVQS